VHDPNDTIAAIATPEGGVRTILRIAGPDTPEVCRGLVRGAGCPQTRGVHQVDLVLDPDLVIGGRLYFFPSPRSYTGQTMAEIHVEAGRPVVDALVQRLLEAGARQAGPGEFTARAYLNGKMDLTQAEAVNEVVSSTNHTHCRDAERLLQGGLSRSVAAVRSQLVHAISLLEAGLDFPEEEGTQACVQQASQALKAVHAGLQGLLSDVAQAQTVTRMRSVGLAGEPNAGKSTLFNALVSQTRSLVSEIPGTTRDVLEAVLDLRHATTVFFDCPGLALRSEDILDQMARQAAAQSLARADLVLFCADLSKAHWDDDLALSRQVAPCSAVCVATKADLVRPADLTERIDHLSRVFGQAFLPVSAKIGMNLDALKDRIERRLMSGASRAGLSDSAQAHVMLTARLRQGVTEAAGHVSKALEALALGQDEVAAMMARAAHQALSDTQRPLEEEVLDALFSRFCIGK